MVLRRQTQAVAAAALFSLLTAGAACAQPGAAPSPSPGERPAAAALQELAAAANLPPSMNTLPVFQGGDAIKISVFPDTNAFPGGIYEIDSDGYVDLPLVGFLQVTGLSVRTLEQLLKEKYVKFLPQPNLTVRPLVRIGLLGGFNRPGLYWIDARESIWAAVRSAGGTQREDGIVKIRWVRDSGIVAKNISGHFQAGKSLYAMGFKSGDQLCVTPRPRETVWERFRSNILPIASIVLSTAVSAAMAYITYDMSQQRQ